MQLNTARKFTRSIIGGGRRGRGLVGTEILSRAIDGWFDNKNWEATYPDVIETGNRPDLNAGQQVIFEEDYKPAAEEYCKINGEDYNPESFKSYVEFAIGSDKYNAISEIIEETSEYLYEAWDYCYGGDGVGEKLFGNYERSSRSVFRNTPVRSIRLPSIRIVGRRR
jgi:hypothetical protein